MTQAPLPDGRAPEGRSAGPGRAEGRAAAGLGRPVPCVVGPTASGKSALAEEVALRLGSMVVSVDAMQVYRGMDVGTAKVPEVERRVPLAMVDVCDVDQEYSVALFQRSAREVVDGALAAGLTPVLCGGTGLYLDAVVDEMSFPEGGTETAARRRYEALAREVGPSGLHDLLARRDPRSAALIHPNNVRRVERALEMLDEGTSYADQHAGLGEHRPHYDARIWAISADRALLYRRIEERVDEMFDCGLVEEVASLVGRGLVRDSTAGQAIGYKEVLAALAGECTLDEAREKIKVRTRRYAKRQLSWLRRDGRARWLDVASTGMDAAVDAIVDDLTRPREA
jgi:tRNA dimethylallyltransferase